MTTDIAVAAISSELAILPDQLNFTAPQLAALRQLGVENAPEGDLALFFHLAKRSGLDPFAKQIHMIGRRTKIKVYDPQRRQQVDDWVMKYTVQTGIDGYRVLGNRCAEERQDELDQDEPLWCGKDRQWVDAWVDAETPPAAAKFVIRKNGKPLCGTVMYAEYLQTDWNGNPNSTWKKRPAGQLAKCAEALAWRMAYPQDFSGIQLEDAAQVIEPDGTPSTGLRPPRIVSAADIVGGRPSKQSEKPDKGQAKGSKRTTKRRASTQKPPSWITPAQIDEASAMLDALDVTSVGEKREFLRKLFNRSDIQSASELTDAEADLLLDELRALTDQSPEFRRAVDGAIDNLAESGQLPEEVDKP